MRSGTSQRRMALIAALVSATALTSAYASAAAAASTAHARTASGRGAVDVLSAGSLNTVLTKKIGPAFHAATGYTLVDTSGGSGTLATDIKSKVDVADVFLSASPAVDATLEGAHNGNWVSWYADFATSPYVLAYYPKSKFAKALRTKPWYDVITSSGFRLGRTNPSQDPGGVLAVKALKTTAKAKHLPALDKLATENSDEYEEDTEQADVQNGQLDASFMYEADASSQGSPFVPLTGTALFGDYTITMVRNAPHVAAAEAFIKFMFSAKVHTLLEADHFGIASPVKVSGHGVPSALKSLLH